MSSIDDILIGLDDINKRITQLDHKMTFIQADVSALRRDMRQDIDANRAEYRGEIVALRGDLAEFINRAKSAIDDAKKKGPKTQTRYSASLQKLLRLKA